MATYSTLFDLAVEILHTKTPFCTEVGVQHALVRLSSPVRVPYR